jgi:hypothetical protein
VGWFIGAGSAVLILGLGDFFSSAGSCPASLQELS